MHYFCIMKSSKSLLLQILTFESPKLTKKCVLLYFTMRHFYSLFKTNTFQKRNFFPCIEKSLKFYCNAYCNSLKFFIGFCAEKCVLLYLIMTEFYNILKFRSFQKSGYTDSIINLLLFPLLIHYYFLPVFHKANSS